MHDRCGGTICFTGAKDICIKTSDTRHLSARDGIDVTEVTVLEFSLENYNKMLPNN